jgi:formylglycine-generating enzyme required for sulfatase activity
LAQHFGEEAVFFDVDSIPLGCDFHHFLTEQVRACQVLVAVIGRHWLDITDEHGQRRLEQDDDFVRIEVQTALQRNIPVVPVLVEGAIMPRATQLPDALRLLARRNAAEVRPGATFHQQLETLVQKLERTLQSITSSSSPVITSQVHTSPPAVASSPVPAPIQIMTNSLGMKLAAIPPGRFTMGSPESETGRLVDEGPQHEVELTKGFHLGVCPVTQDEYQQIVGSNPSNFTSDPRRPVEKVSWFDAVAFCNRLSERELLSPFYTIQGEQVRIAGGDGYRLPTEAEWEYACRTGTTTRWWFGDDESRLGEFAWYGSNFGSTTHPVGEKPANAWRLRDVYGNVWEWCWDCFGKYSSGRAVDPTGPESGERRVLSGGSWCSSSQFCRSAFRYSLQPVLRINNVGFRVART